MTPPQRHSRDERADDRDDVVLTRVGSAVGLAVVVGAVAALTLVAGVIAFLVSLL